MNSVTKTILLAGVGVIALASCASEKGPGKIGTKNDIAIRNNGLPGQKQDPGTPPSSTEAQTAQSGDFSSTIEQGEAAPAPSVDQAETLPQTEAASQEIAESTAPIASTTNAPTNDTGEPGSTSPTETDPIAATAAPQSIPQEQNIQAAPPQNASANSATPAPTLSGASAVATAPETSAPMSDTPAMTATREGASYAPPASTPAEQTPSSVYPSADYGGTQAAAPVPVRNEPAPAGTGAYKMRDPNAAYSPKAAAAAGAMTTSVEPEPDNQVPSSNASAPVPGGDVRSAQQALSAQGLYKGPVNGQTNAEFLNALSLYQGMNKLPQGGLNAETMQSLSSGSSQQPAPQPIEQPASQPVDAGSPYAPTQGGDASADPAAAQSGYGGY